MVTYSITLKGQRINRIEDIQNNFQVYELMDLMNSGRLRSWLEQRGYPEYIEKLSIWTSTDRKKKKQLLYDVFDIPYDAATEYNITDELLYQQKKQLVKEEFDHDACVNSQSDLDSKLNQILRDSDKPRHTIYLNNCNHNGYDIPLKPTNVHYIGYGNYHSNFTDVNLLYTDEKYEKYGITFENINVHLKVPENMDYMEFQHRKEDWINSHRKRDKELDAFMDIIRAEVASDKDSIY